MYTHIAQLITHTTYVYIAAAYLAIMSVSLLAYCRGSLRVKGCTYLIWYHKARSDRNRKGGGVACYIRSNICFNLKTCLSNNIENIFIDLLFPKTKPIMVSVIYKPTNQTRIYIMNTTFLEILIQTFFLQENIFLINRTNLGSSIMNFRRKLKNILSFVGHTALSS